MDSKASLALYLLGSLLVAGGVAWAAILMGVPPVWIGVVAMILVGFGIRGAVKKTQRGPWLPVSKSQVGTPRERAPTRVRTTRWLGGARAGRPDRALGLSRPPLLPYDRTISD